MQEMQIPSLGQVDTLEKEMTTNWSILAWKTPWTEEPAGLPFTASQRIVHDGAGSTATGAPLEREAHRESGNQVYMNPKPRRGQ